MTYPPVDQIAVLLAVYFVLGVLSALIWGRIGWNDKTTQHILRTAGYTAAKSGMVNTQKLLIGLWAVMVPMFIADRTWDAFIGIGDPHMKHRAEYNRRLESYRKLCQLEASAGGEATATPPEPWCDCQEAQRRTPSESDKEIQHRIELIRRRLAQAPELKSEVATLDTVERLLKEQNRWR